MFYTCVHKFVLPLLIFGKKMISLNVFGVGVFVS